MKRMNFLIMFAMIIFLRCFTVYEPPRDNKNDVWGDYYVSSFTPTITITPADGATEIAPDTNIVLTFSEAAVSTGWKVTINGTDYTSGTWSSNNTVLTIDPTSDFQWSKIINVKITGFIAEYDKKTMFPEKTNSFKTEIAYPVSDTGQTGDYTATFGEDSNYVNIPNARSFTGPTQYGASDYTTKDNVTGLIWKTCSEGQTGVTCTGTATVMNWDTALTICAALNSANNNAGYAGRADWRLPNIQELSTLIDYGIYNPAIDIAYFPGAQSSYDWSSSTFVNNTSYAWYVYFFYGYVLDTVKTNILSVRCVSGP